jgi:hypothetical protein
LNEQTETIGATEYTRYSPVVENEATVYDTEQFIVRFQYSSHNMSNSTTQASVDEPDFHITTPYLKARVVLECSTSYFYSLNSIGNLERETDGDLTTLYIVADSYFDHNTTPDYDAVFLPIHVTYTP